MAKKLKVYRTSIGFFDLAIAAPSMKAAAEAWGAGSDIFKRGFAKQTEDPKGGESGDGRARRRVASAGWIRMGNSPKGLSFRKHPRGARRLRRVVRNAGMTEFKPETKSAEKAKRNAAAALEKEKKQAARDRAKIEAERERAKKQRERMIAKADVDVRTGSYPSRRRHESHQAATRRTG